MPTSKRPDNDDGFVAVEAKPDANAGMTDEDLATLRRVSEAARWRPIRDIGDAMVNAYAQRCGNCFYFQAPYCKRHAPIGFDKVEGAVWPRPPAGEKDWCGDHKRESAVVAEALRSPA